MIKKVSKRDFVRQVSQYLKEPGEYLLEGRDEESLVVTIGSYVEPKDPPALDGGADLAEQPFDPENGVFRRDRYGRVFVPVRYLDQFDFNGRRRTAVESKDYREAHSNGLVS